MGPTCCKDFTELIKMGVSVYYDEEEKQWYVVTDEAITISVNYCPYCGKTLKKEESQ